jgi:hypothetical protein
MKYRPISDFQYYRLRATLIEVTLDHEDVTLLIEIS